MKMKTKLGHADINVLVEACKRGNEDAYMEVYRRYYRNMYNVALRILNDTAEAEDVMQESFLGAFNKLETFSGTVAFGAWLKKIVVNRALDVIKTRKALISIDQVPDITEEEVTEEYLAYKDMNVQSVKEAIFSLPEGYRVVLSLYLIEGYDHDEIAQILNISNATSRTQYHRARKKLAAILNELKAVS